MAIVITPDTDRFELSDQYTEEVYGITFEKSLVGNVDASAWRCIAEDMLRQMSEEEAREAFDYLARMHDVDVIELDSVAHTIMQALECTPEAAAGLREWVFDGCSDSLASLRQLDADLSMYSAWYPDFKTLEADGFTEREGVLYEKQIDSEPVKCEAEVWYDMSFGYFVMWR